MELPEQQQTALNDVLQAVLLDEELLVVLEQVVRLETPQGSVLCLFFCTRSLGIRDLELGKIVFEISSPPFNPTASFVLGWSPLAV